MNHNSQIDLDKLEHLLIGEASLANVNEFSLSSLSTFFFFIIDLPMLKTIIILDYAMQNTKAVTLSSIIKY